MVIKVRKIGNSIGVLLPKAIIEQCAIKDQVNLEVKEDAVIIKAIKVNPREGWSESFLKAGSLDNHESLIPEYLDHSFDKEEWTW